VGSELRQSSPNTPSHEDTRRRDARHGLAAVVTPMVFGSSGIDRDRWALRYPRHGRQLRPFRADCPILHGRQFPPPAHDGQNLPNQDRPAGPARATTALPCRSAARATRPASAASSRPRRDPDRAARPARALRSLPPDHPGFVFRGSWVRFQRFLGSFSKFRGSGGPFWVRFHAASARRAAGPTA
jgi:hypothetical protein